MKHAQTLFRCRAAFAGTLAVAMLATSPSVAADIIFRMGYSEGSAGS